MKNIKSINASIMLISVVMMWNCAKSNTPYIVMGGDKITVDELKTSHPEQFNQIENEYHSKLISLLNEVAVQKMLEKEAKEKNTDVKSYMQDFYNRVPSPSVEEINSVYNNLKASGSLPKGSPEDLTMQISEYLKREKANEMVHNEIGRLKKKYEYNLVMGKEVKKFDVDIKDEPFRGNPDGKIVIVEFSDFECPFCQRAQKTTAQVREKYGDKIKWVFKDFPLEFHEHALRAHVAANCVLREKSEQYWKYFDLIFAENRTPDTLSETSLEKLAVSLGVDRSRYKLCINDESIKKEISEDISQGSKLGVNGTPAFFINGRFLSGAQPFSEFESIIEEEL